ncbi:MAG: 16S rRNA (adenine(1518)-N(6)/adenine(1519)-N(6))-dimethyltransferase RsmA [Hyphomicrobium sp.]|jgi:16S rRNA (adenine1518-N6/adenine1519-N6)-dimethyltransferase
MTASEREISGASPDGLPPLRDILRAYGLEAKKSLGQNFILDLNLTRRIARAAGSLTGRTVVEVGPGPGGLTRALLLEGAQRVVAVERDERVRGALEMIADRYPGQLDVHFGDALHADWLQLLKPGAGPAVIVANLPYGIATLLLTGWLDSEPWPPWFDRMVLMFQKEVAERIVASPGCKAYGRLSVLAQWRTAARVVMHVPREAFTPSPKVESAVVEFIPHKEPTPPCSPQALAKVTAAAFGQRRKMLRASLKQLGDAEQLLEATGIAGTLRAEDLSVKDFARMALVFERSNLQRR